MTSLINHYVIHGFQKYKNSVHKRIPLHIGNLNASFDTRLTFEKKTFTIQICDCVVGCCGVTVYNGKPLPTKKINKIIWKYISEYITDSVGLPTVIEDQTKWKISNIN